MNGTETHCPAGRLSSFWVLGVAALALLGMSGAGWAQSGGFNSTTDSVTFAANGNPILVINDGKTNGVVTSTPYSQFTGNVTIDGTLESKGAMSADTTLTIGASVTAPAYYHSSDERLKTDIHPIHAALGKLLAIKGVTFDWKKDGRPDMGVIAQDVAKVFPNVVSRGADGKGMMAVEYDSLAGPMIESIRELKQENDAMKAQLTEIRATLKVLEKDNARLRSVEADGENRAARPAPAAEP
jgi:hypothetical protein